MDDNALKSASRATAKAEWKTRPVSRETALRREVVMQATVQITPEGMVIANLDSDDYAEDDETRALIGLQADDMLDQCARVAIAAWFEIRSRDEAEDGE